MSTLLIIIFLIIVAVIGYIYYKKYYMKDRRRRPLSQVASLDDIRDSALLETGETTIETLGNSDAFNLSNTM